ncbi:MAG: O-antigen ligase family protein [Mobilitalea sp.]
MQSWSFEKRAIIIESIALKRRMNITLTKTNILTFSTFSIFLPYMLSGIILVFLAIYVAANKHTRQQILNYNNSKLLKFCLAYVLLVPIIYRNWFGLAVGFGMILAIILGMYIRSVMTRVLYERVLTMICTLSLTSAGYAMTEKLLNLISDGRHSHRIAAVFSHPNYFGTMVGTVIIICAYKVLTNQENKVFYTMVAAINVISMYLCKSMFVWVEIFIGITVLLLVLKKYRLLAFWFLGAALGAFLIFVQNFNIIPRLSDVGVTVKLRGQIWRMAIEEIKKAPWFGHGFMSFSYLYDSTYRNQLIPHAHNIYLDMMLNFGVIGTVMFVGYILKYYGLIIRARIKEKDIMISSLILAVTAAALAHGFTDLTLLWIQTFPLFLIILSGLGVDENSRKQRINTDIV